MMGTILNFDMRSGQGIIRAQDGNRYGFQDSTWLDREQAPSAGMQVDFDVAGNTASNIIAMRAGGQGAPGASTAASASSNGTVLGCASLGLGLLGFVPAFGGLCAILGLIVGIIGRKQAKRTNNSTGNLLSLLGIGLSCVTLVVAVIMIFALSGLMMGVGSSGFK